jgi:hypothetical protein
MVALSQKYPEQQFAQVLFPCNQVLYHVVWATV